MSTARSLGALLVALLFVAPLTFLVSGALREPGLLPTDTFALVPDPVTTAAIERAFDLVRLGRLFLNSAIVALIAVPIAVVVASWAGFGMVLLPAKARRLAVGLSLVLLMVPLAALWLPRFVIFRSLGFVDTWVPLIAPALLGMSPFYVLLFYWSYRRVPRDLIDAGRLEGLGAFGLWWRVASPLVRPTTFAVGALAFVTTWGNFIDPLLFINDPDRATLPLGVHSLAAVGPTGFPVVLAAALVATLPAVIAFALVQRRFLQNTREAGWLGR
ncbi:MAG TPA: carbohydrate ABC transporter permease [Solirubrobacteraceae bacterium]|nr:carbohydrate ABC transporter permease [Solirubrobacteraceae bacterium]